MKFKGRNGGLAGELRNHILMMRMFVVSLIVCMIPTIILLCAKNPYFYVFLIMPALSLFLAFFVFAFVKYDETVFLSGQRKDHVFEIKNNTLYKNGKEIKLIQAIKIYRYKGFLYMETSHSMFVIKDADYVDGSREALITWAKGKGIKVRCGY